MRFMFAGMGLPLAQDDRRMTPGRSGAAGRAGGHGHRALLGPDHSRKIVRRGAGRAAAGEEGQRSQQEESTGRAGFEDRIDPEGVRGPRGDV